MHYRFVLSVGGIQWQSDDMYGPTCSAAKPCGWSDGGAGAKPSGC